MVENRVREVLISDMLITVGRTGEGGLSFALFGPVNALVPEIELTEEFTEKNAQIFSLAFGAAMHGRDDSFEHCGQHVEDVEIGHSEFV